MATTSEQMRAWTGPALFSFGFRPFFLGAAVWAALAMVLWIAMLMGAVEVPTALEPVSWHAHEFLFGYLGAVLAGFLMTAVPNWTGRMPIIGWPLAGLFGLWLAGRVAIAVSAGLPPLLVGIVDLSFLILLAIAMMREIVAGRNWRNLVIIALLAFFIVANGIFHLEAARGVYAAEGVGIRLGLGAAVVMIGLIGGRIIPSFTRNWMAKQGHEKLPVPPMQMFDRVSLLALVLSLLVWIAAPFHVVSGVLLLVAGVLHTARLTRWSGRHTGAETLVWVLHAAYVFVPLGALALGLSILLPGAMGQATAQHFWMAGAIGLMTLAVMTRASLGHTGRPLTAGRGTLVIYVALIMSVLARVLADPMPEWANPLYALSGALWLVAFGGFAVLYGPMLLKPRPKG